jgi:hypothetical protein
LIIKRHYRKKKGAGRKRGETDRRNVSGQLIFRNF